MKLDDLELFLAVVKSGSFAAAARKKNIPTSTLSRRVQQLETDTGRKLLLRHAKEMSLTKDGQLFVQQFSTLFDDIETRLINIAEEKEQLSGLIVMNSPINPIQHPIGQLALEFARLHPKVQLRFQLGNQLDYYMRGDIDIALRFGKQPASDWIQKWIAHNPSLLCASREYLDTHPPVTHPNQLHQHHLLTSNPAHKWFFRHPDGETFQMVHNARIQSDELESVHYAAAAGFGIAKLPEWYATELIHRHELAAVIPEWQMEGTDLVILHPQRKLLSERALALIDYINTHWTGVTSTSLLTREHRRET
ncbi:LysR family transcriptional regulator [Photobacterium sp. TY1-4]|uniref:LysR family transcriptional regulator n=1 Tax=Photobacterium sp. TY1-4 TaxID=2899122 RepID=UPI0021BEBD0A|nr:LysR family transcriptional regulator [Photobacterium sp. TY1-4]UXI04221.1 LysR family transcriptional regulator [Photobacterium sp. TY1-4]